MKLYEVNRISLRALVIKELRHAQWLYRKELRSLRRELRGHAGSAVGDSRVWGCFFLLRAATGRRLEELKELGQTLGAQERSWSRGAYKLVSLE